MLSDEDQIRTLVQAWLSATKADDVVFLVSGRPPMRKAEFAMLSQVPPDTHSRQPNEKE